MNESALLRSVLDWLQYQENPGKLMFLRLNSGTMFPSYTNKQGQTKSYRVSLCPEGTADVLVIRYEGCSMEGCRIVDIIFLETKSKNGKLSEAQEAFKLKAEAQGAEYMVIRNVEQVIERLEG